MASQEIKSKTNIGSSSLILIFIVLCLATFGLLSLSSSGSDWTLAEKNAEAVKGYYEADNQAEIFYQTADHTVREIYSSNKDEAARKELLSETLGAGYLAKENKIVTGIPMERGQVMQVELGFTGDEDEPLSVLVWKVYNQEDYEIDSSVPLYTED